MDKIQFFILLIGEMAPEIIVPDQE